MKTRILIILFLCLPLLFLGNPPSTSASFAGEEGFQSFLYEYGNPPPEVIALRAARATTETDMDMQGTAWQPQFRGHFKWAVKPWGVETKAGDGYGDTYQWVHISIPVPYYVQGEQQYLSYVEFCAKSDNPTETKPTKIEVWSYQTRVYMGTITWPDSTATLCQSVILTPPYLASYLGVSVLVKYANTTDQLDLYGAWAMFEP